MWNSARRPYYDTSSLKYEETAGDFDIQHIDEIVDRRD